MKQGSLPIVLLLILSLLYSCTSTRTDTSNNQSTTEPEVKNVLINGDSLHYIDVGKGEPVVLVHGSLGDYRTWDAQIKEFSKSYRVIAYSRRYAYPNNKSVTDSADYSVTPHTKDLNEFLKALNAGPVHLIGHSYGAYTTLLTAMEHPEYVKTLTLGEPPVMSLLQNVQGGDTMARNFVTQFFMPAVEAFKVNDTLKAVKIFIHGVMDDSLYFDRLPERDRQLFMTNVLETRGTASTQNPFPLVTCDDLKKLKMPVLLVEGDKSPLYIRSIMDELQRCITANEIATLANTTHGLEYENPVEFNRAVIKFLDKH